jgi:hypothetical protein
MDRVIEFHGSFHGFVDYSLCFPAQDVLWRVTGILLFLGMWIPTIPQYYKVIARRSSFGLDALTYFVTVVAQCSLATNVLALRPSDFAGALQRPFGVVMWRILTFINAAATWLANLGLAFEVLIFFDRKPRVHRPESQIRWEEVFGAVLMIAAAFICLCLFAIPFALGAVHEFESPQLVLFGKILGIVTAVIRLVQHVPQIITTCRLRSPGSLSIISLGVQAPGALLSAMFMLVGQQDDWTTAIAAFVTSVEKGILLVICIVFNVRNGQCKCPSKSPDKEPGPEVELENYLTV